MRLDGQTIVVTGGASGLGLATVEMAVAAGASAIIVDNNEPAGVAAAARYGNKALFVGADVTSGADVQRAVDTALETFGAVHGLVCA
ncbi:MAG: SDR family NAD(P)-dependent oxidoreductase, partial [Vicinamibacterales bacterium]